jgi:hypothetical protein
MFITPVFAEMHLVEMAPPFQLYLLQNQLYHYLQSEKNNSNAFQYLDGPTTFVVRPQIISCLLRRHFNKTFVQIFLRLWFISLFGITHKCWAYNISDTIAGIGTFSSLDTLATVLQRYGLTLDWYDGLLAFKRNMATSSGNTNFTILFSDIPFISLTEIALSSLIRLLNRNFNLRVTQHIIHFGQSNEFSL